MTSSESFLTVLGELCFQVPSQATVEARKPALFSRQVSSYTQLNDVTFYPSATRPCLQHYNQPTYVNCRVHKHCRIKGKDIHSIVFHLKLFTARLALLSLFGSASRRAYTVSTGRDTPDTLFGGWIVKLTTMSENHEGVPLTRSGNPPIWFVVYDLFILLLYTIPVKYRDKSVHSDQ